MNKARMEPSPKLHTQTISVKHKVRVQRAPGNFLEGGEGGEGRQGGMLGASRLSRQILHVTERYFSNRLQ